VSAHPEDKPTRPWQEIAADLTKETDPQKFTRARSGRKKITLVWHGLCSQMLRAEVHDKVPIPDVRYLS
jgi:hypothetical protein